MREYLEQGELCTSQGMVPLMSACEERCGSLQQDPAKAVGNQESAGNRSTPGSVRQADIPWSGGVGCGVCGFGGFATRPTQKCPPLWGGEYLRHGPKHTWGTRKTRVSLCGVVRVLYRPYACSSPRCPRAGHHGVLPVPWSVRSVNASMSPSRNPSVDRR